MGGSMRNNTKTMSEPRVSRPSLLICESRERGGPTLWIGALSILEPLQPNVVPNKGTTGGAQRINLAALRLFLGSPVHFSHRYRAVAPWGLFIFPLRDSGRRPRISVPLQPPAHIAAEMGRETERETSHREEGRVHFASRRPVKRDRRRLASLIVP